MSDSIPEQAPVPQAAPSAPAEGEVSQQAPAAEPAPTTGGETQAGPEDIDRFLEAAIRDEFPDSDSAEAGQPEDDPEEKVTLTRAELEAQREQAAQSARDRAAYERQLAERQAAEDMRVRESIRSRLADGIRRAVENGDDPPPTLAEDVMRDYEGHYMRKALGEVDKYYTQAQFRAMNRLEGIQDAPEELFEPLKRNHANKEDEFLASMVVAHNLGWVRATAEYEEKLEKEAQKLARQYGQALTKRTLQYMGSGIPEKGTPTQAPTATKGGLPSDEEIRRHRESGNDEWWEQNRERIFEARRRRR